jgi:hypothetical protein
MEIRRRPQRTRSYALNLQFDDPTGPLASSPGWRRPALTKEVSCSCVA